MERLRGAKPLFTNSPFPLSRGRGINPVRNSNGVKGDGVAK